jgi:hypothetical protein
MAVARVLRTVNKYCTPARRVSRPGHNDLDRIRGGCPLEPAESADFLGFPAPGVYAEGESQKP